MNIVEKIFSEILRKKNLNQTQLSGYLGYSVNAVSKWKLRGVIPDKSKKLLNEKLGISFQFLDTATGPFYESDVDYSDTNTDNNILSEPSSTYTKERNILHIPIEAEAGFVGGFSSSINIEDTEQWGIPDFKGAALSFKVKGDSMEDTLKAGDILITRRKPIENIDSIINDYIYAIEFKDGVQVKRLQKHLTPGLIWIVSDNTDYDMVEVDLNDVLAIYQGRRIITHDLRQKLRYE